MKTALKWLPEVVGVLRLVPAVRKYFEVERRRARAGLISDLAQDVLALVAMQEGVSISEASQLDSLIDRLEAKLLGEGLVGKANARDIAKASAAGVVAKLRAREDLLDG